MIMNTADGICEAEIAIAGCGNVTGRSACGSYVSKKNLERYIGL